MSTTLKFNYSAFAEIIDFGKTKKLCYVCVNNLARKTKHCYACANDLTDTYRYDGTE